MGRMGLVRMLIIMWRESRVQVGQRQVHNDLRDVEHQTCFSVMLDCVYLSSF